MSNAGAVAANDAFEAFVATPLHKMRDDAWDEYFEALVPWLTDADALLRLRATERLTMAVLWSEPHRRSDSRTSTDIDPWPRFDWMLQQIDIAHAAHTDTVPNFLRELRFKSVDDAVRPRLLRWLQELRNNPRPGVADDVVKGTMLLVERHNLYDKVSLERLISLLDHASDYVRACAARQLSGIDDEATNLATLFDMIKAKDMARPGIAGPFWSEWHLGSVELPVDPIIWMMDILEKRAGPEPDDMPFNGIDFYLHELCDHSPETVQRMIDGGFLRIAIETATERRAVVPGMEPVLRRLAEHPDGRVSIRAAGHLARYYRILHPSPPRHPIRRWLDWSPDADVFTLHTGENSALTMVTIYPKTADDLLDDQLAWTLIDRIVPPELRGEVVRHPLNLDRSRPAAPYVARDRLLIRFASNVHLELNGDAQAKRWSRIEIAGGALGTRWKAFSLGELEAKPLDGAPTS